MLIVAAPGQGAQKPGFLTPWLELDGARERLTWWSAVTGLDLVHYGTEADTEEIRDTAVAQPLLVSAGLLAAHELFGHLGDAPRCIGVTAGHSVGEFTAGALAGVWAPETALVLVRERGQAMAEAAKASPTSMTAVLGGDPDTVLAKLDELDLTAANNNGAGQIVAAGTTEQLAALEADPPARARLRPLSVAGAFHTEHMSPATRALREVTPKTQSADPATRLLSNLDGAVVDRAADFVERVVTQVERPVRWDLCMASMNELSASAIIELPPAGTLTGLARRELPDVERLSLNSPDDLDHARALVAAHAGTAEGHPPEWRLLVAPLAGTFRSGHVTPGTPIEPGGVVGRVESRREEHPVSSSWAGTVLERLVDDGDPVTAGQPLLRLRPEVVGS